MELLEIIEHCPKDNIIGDNLIRAYKIINNPKYEKIVCTISGGADSDIVLDICSKIDQGKIEYIWFDTGLEYKATKEHIRYLEQKYGITIQRRKAIKSIPKCCKEYGQPFLSKQVSEWMERLQRHGFKWEDKSFSDLCEEYPKCKAALRWWCNCWGEKSRFNISYNKWLKEFLIANPPDNILISNKCCKYAKKDVLHKAISDERYNLNISGTRKAEGGARSSAYKSCFSESVEEHDNYRPIWWYSNETKLVYEQHYGVVHSECYTKYGLKRTGCAGCPFGRDFEIELAVMKEYESQLYRAVSNIFGDSYSYTRKYKMFCTWMKLLNEQN